MGTRKFFWSRETETEPQPQAINGASDSLADRLALGPLPLPDALRYAIALAEALREIHGRGRVYAFLQPAGVTLVGGQIRLAPCGPAAISPYFSPEQVAGHDLDARTDIFSLGTVMYEMFSGRRAFGAATRTAVRMEILDRDPAPLDCVPPALSRLVVRCLEKKPERRVQRIEILLAALKLQEIMTGPMTNPPPGPKPVPPRR